MTIISVPSQKNHLDFSHNKSKAILRRLVLRELQRTWRPNHYEARRTMYNPEIRDGISITQLYGINKLKNSYKLNY